MGRYTNIETIQEPKKPRYYRTVKYPEVPLSSEDVYVVTTQGDRLDLLASQYYGDSSLYWIIGIANPDATSQNSLFISPGTQLRIPANYSAVITQYQTLNRL